MHDCQDGGRLRGRRHQAILSARSAVSPIPPVRDAVPLGVVKLSPTPWLPNDAKVRRSDGSRPRDSEGGGTQGEQDKRMNVGPP